MTVCVRFAPSPTGLLHVGNARMALANYLLARKSRGRFVLRIDDTDRERSKPEYAAAIRRDLAWLGLAWDREVRQSERLALYAEAAERLKQAGHLYPCYETAEELELKRKSLLARGRPPIYDRAALALSDAERRGLEAQGRKAHWRFRLAPGEIAWNDAVRGAQRFSAEALSDPVLLREDGTFLYMLPSAVDDIALGITHIVRGEDHVSNTAVQLRIFSALGKNPEDIVFAHLPLLADAGGKSLSKRLGSLSLDELRAEGIEPMVLASLLAKLGTTDAVEPKASLDDLAGAFDLAKFARATPRFDKDELVRLNARLLSALPFEAVRERLAAMGLRDADEAFWLAVRPNLSRLVEAEAWWRICRAALAPVVEEPEYLKIAAELLPEEPWDETTWSAWIEALKMASGRKGAALYRPLRLALTAQDRGPELRNLLPIIGRARAAARLRGRTA